MQPILPEMSAIFTTDQQPSYLVPLPVAQVNQCCPFSPSGTPSMLVASGILHQVKGQQRLFSSLLLPQQQG